MNRHARRAAAAKDRRRRQWGDGILHFHAAARGALETYIVAADDYPLLLARAAVGEPTATALARAITGWMQKAIGPGSDFLCLDCDVRFGPNAAAPAAFSVSLPFASQDCCLVTGICAACVRSGKDLQAAALRRMRGIWPDAYSAKLGEIQ
jgi:hypothetical protein